MRVDSCGRGEVGERRVYQIVGMTHGETERGGGNLLLLLTRGGECKERFFVFVTHFLTGFPGLFCS